jgi:hypothetical protein
MAAMFVVALTVPRAWHAPHGGLAGPVVLVCAYLLVRSAHLCVYAVAAVGDTPVTAEPARPPAGPAAAAPGGAAQDP